MEFVDSANDDDTVFEDNGVKVIIDAKSLVYLDGTEVDFDFYRRQCQLFGNINIFNLCCFVQCFAFNPFC
jgi:Fe-S cluster assembly iron-binding protein IscA